MEIRFAQHRIFADQPVMLGIEHIRRDEPVGYCQPALVVGGAILRNDQVEIEHEAVEPGLAETRSVKQDRSTRGSMPGCNCGCERSNSRIDRLAQLPGNQIAQIRHGSASASAYPELRRLA